MDVLKKIKDAGVVGAGGAGFPTHVKIDCQADIVIANGAECEPLLRVDQQLMASQAEQVAAGLEAAVRQTGAGEGVIYLKSHYKEAIGALTRAISGRDGIRLFITDSTYPAGDEQQIIYDVTGRVVPPGGLPKDVGCVVSNVSTLADIARALEDKPVLDKYVTVGGAVKRPCTVKAPVGTALRDLLEHAGGAVGECEYIVGGPCMGSVAKDLAQPVTKTTGGLLAIPKGHPLLDKKGGELNYKMMQSVCCQCSMCTQMCPRNALGLGTSPHKAMRALAAGADLLGDPGNLMTCCDCGVCTYYACNFGLNPADVMKKLKRSLADMGVKASDGRQYEPDPFIGGKKLPTRRLISRLGLDEYNVDAPMEEQLLKPKKVRIPGKMHIGAPGTAVVKQGEKVQRGQLIWDIPDGKMGAKIHASISGVVEAVGDYIEIREEI